MSRYDKRKIQRRQLRLLEQVVSGYDKALASGAVIDQDTAAVLEVSRKKADELREQVKPSR